MTNKIFQDPTTNIPKSDPQFVRVPFEGSDIAGRADFIPKTGVNQKLGVAHVSTTKGK